MSKVLKARFLRLLLLLLAPAFSGVLLVLAFPTYDQAWLAWVGLVPLLVATSDRSSKYGFLLWYVYGLIFFAGVCDWILESPGYSLLHHILAGLFLGAPFALFGLTFSFLSKRLGRASALFAAPFAWLCIEYIRSNFSFLALPWGLLAHSQHQVPSIIQISSVTGAYGVSFLIVMVNSAFAAMVLFLEHRLKVTQSLFYPPISKRGVVALVVTAALLTTLSLVYGLMIVSKPLVGERIKLTVVQGNIAQSKKWHPKYANFIMQTYADLTKTASEDQPRLIIWPEAATPRAITRDRRLYSQVRHITERAETYLLLGSSHHQKFKVGHRQIAKFYNSAFLINPENGLNNQRYDKIRLVPFGEYIPMKETIPWSYIGVPNIGSFMPGEKYTVFKCPDFRFSVTICWESTFPDLVRSFIKEGAQFMINITNEAWYTKTSAPYQFVAINVFRAVENRIYVVRCANNGISCFIDPYGQIVDKVEDATGEDLFVRGLLTETVVPLDSKTIYTRYGNWFAWLCLACSVGFLLTSFLRKKYKPRFKMR